METDEAEGLPLDPVTNETVDWAALVESVRAGETCGMEKLYLLFERGARFFLYRRLGPQELDDRLHDVFLIVVLAIRKGELREPERLMGFIRTVVRRQVAAQIDNLVHMRREEIALEPTTILADRAGTPEQSAMGAEQLEMMQRVLKALSTRDREILTRFYLREESQEVICEDMNLTLTQFRLLKSRAKARFGELGRRRLDSKSGNFFVRTFARLSH